LPDPAVIQLMCRIDEVDRARMQNGRAVLVRVDALPDRELTGSVQSISLMSRPDFAQFPPTRNFDLVVGLSDNDPRLRSGMSATARIELEGLNDALVVPATAVFQRGGAPTVYEIDGSSVVPRRVSILRRGRDQIAIADGVKEHTRVSLKDPELETAAR